MRRDRSPWGLNHPIYGLTPFRASECDKFSLVPQGVGWFVITGFTLIPFFKILKAGRLPNTPKTENQLAFKP